jgi:5'-deoxynucleotidase YfbR-like HD superfamily hydrolase
MTEENIEQTLTDLHQEISTLAKEFRKDYKRSKKDFIEAAENNDRVGEKYADELDDLLLTLKNNMQNLSEYVEDEIDTFTFTGKEFASETANNIDKMLQKVTGTLGELIGFLEDLSFEGAGKLSLDYFDEFMEKLENIERPLHDIIMEK